jgi:hypothetical protein
MLYEFRSYEAAPGKLEALSRRFKDDTVPLFTRHGIEPIGFWFPEGVNQLVYILRWTDREESEARWKAFRADPEWQERRTASEKDGPLAANITSQFWQPTAYSQIG